MCLYLLVIKNDFLLLFDQQTSIKAGYIISVNSFYLYQKNLNMVFYATNKYLHWCIKFAQTLKVALEKLPLCD